jgi:hypothetical protein
MWVPSLGLRKEDEDILQSNRAWLNDSIINSAQRPYIQTVSKCEGSSKYFISDQIDKVVS